MRMTPEALAAFEAHVIACYPAEACGVLAKGCFVPCENVADNPRTDFAISAQELAQIELTKGPVEAVLHSHPYDITKPPAFPPEWPSHLDMHSWMQGKTRWGIVATDGEGISPVLWMDDASPAPLEGREFVWGVNDCYSLIRDWFRFERGITLPNYPRQWKFWERGQALYDDNFTDAGFVEIAENDVKPGDCALMRIRTAVSTHAAVITGPNTILHHLLHRQSGYDSLLKWRPFVTKYVRYKGEK